MSYKLRNKYFNPKLAAMVGDITMLITPATLQTQAGSVTGARTVNVQLITSNKRLHKWLSATYTTTASIAKSSTSGTATIPSTTLTIVNGKGTVVITRGGTYADNDTNTLTIGNISVKGTTVTGGTSVETAKEE